MLQVPVAIGIQRQNTTVALIKSSAEEESIAKAQYFFLFLYFISWHNLFGYSSPDPSKNSTHQTKPQCF